MIRITTPANKLSQKAGGTGLRTELRTGLRRSWAFGLLALLLCVAATGLAAPAAAQTTAAPLRGAVYAWDNGRLLRVPQVAVSTGLAQTRSDAEGRFEFAANQRSGRIMAVKPGFDVVRRDVYGDYTIIVLRELIARAVFVGFTQSPDPRVQDWIRDLIERDLINAVVIDIKDESGNVAHFAATPAADAIGATKPENGMSAFLSELGELGVYRIGRVVTFLDSRYTGAHPNNALRHVNGNSFRDGGGQRWSSPFSSEARRYNVEIGAAAAAHVDEVQYDYVRLPYENGLAERFTYNARQRVAAIDTFAEEAAEAVHLAGAAISFDVFGIIAISVDDQGIGQSYRSLSEHLDYLSPMLYPSGWNAGQFGLTYPPGQPGLVIRYSMAATLEKIAEGSHVEVRPWLQDFTDYGPRRVFYGIGQVRDQIREAAANGGYGFMLWDTRLEYQETALETTSDLVWSPRWASIAN